MCSSVMSVGVCVFGDTIIPDVGALDLIHHVLMCDGLCLQVQIQDMCICPLCITKPIPVTFSVKLLKLSFIERFPRLETSL